MAVAKTFLREMFASYADLRVGSYVLPYDVRKPIGRRYPG